MSAQQDGSYRMIAADVAADQLRLAEVPALTLCGRCEEWRFYGTVVEGQRAFREHQLLEHPGAVDRGRTARRRAAKDAAR